MRVIEGGAPEDDDRPAITVDGARDLLLSYARDSGERLTSLFGQEYEIAEWAEREGYQIVGRARDRKVHSQSLVDDRLGLMAVVEAVEQNHADGVVVHRLDRLARDWYVQDDAIHRIWGAGGRVFSTDHGEWGPDRPGDPQWWQRKKFAEIAEAELHTLLARLKDGRDQKSRRGGYVGGNRFERRYGDELVVIQGRRDWRPIPDEQVTVRRIRAACPDGRGYAAMARTLNEEGVPTVTGKPWSTKVVRSIALRPTRVVLLPSLPSVVEPLEWVREARGA